MSAANDKKNAARYLWLKKYFRTSEDHFSKTPVRHSRVFFSKIKNLNKAIDEKIKEGKP